MMPRYDIQCLRGISITSVVLFHLFPEYFPNGYLGVDVFFVISGYLMSNILQKTEIKLKEISDFYYRRIKRICTLYYPILVSISLLKHWLQADVWWKINNTYAIISAFFVTNHKIMKDHSDYFDEFKADTTSNNLFIHCWSLSVEFQFYLIVPFIIFSIRKLNCIGFQTIALLLIIASSYSITFISVDRNFTFNFMPARIWQFSVGILASMFEKSSMKCKKLQQFEDCISQLEIALLSCIFLVFLPVSMAETASRFMVTSIAGFIIFRNYEKVLNSNILAYIGDLSYVIYLVHWPIIAFFRFSRNPLFILYLIILISVIIHHAFENIILRQNRKIISLTILLSILGGVCVQWSQVQYPNQWSKSYPPEYKTAIEKNLEFMEPEWKFTKCEQIPIPEYPNGLKTGFGHCRYPKGNGTQKILLLGNSYTLNQADAIYKSFAGNYSSFEYVAIIANFVFFEIETDNSLFHSQFSQRIAEQLRPDVIFIITRYTEQQMVPISDFNTDQVINIYNQRLETLQGLTKRIYIMDVFPRFPINYLNYYVENLEMGYDKLQQFSITKHKVDMEMKYAAQRLKQIKCKKCETFDLSPYFLQDDRYFGYDNTTLLAYFDNEIHLTTAGIQKIIPFYETFAKNMTFFEEI